MESAFHGADGSSTGQLQNLRPGVQISKRNTHVLGTSRHFQRNDHHMATQCPTGQGSRLEDKGQMAGTEAMEPAANKLLLLAASNGWLDEVKELLQSRADLETRSGDGCYQTPLHSAAEEGHRDVVQLLLEMNAEIEIRDRSGNTPLHLAASEGHRDLVQLLLEKSAEIEAKSSSGQTPLFLAAKWGQIEVAQLLLEKNVQIGTTDKDGQTPISYASGKVFDVLLEHIPKQAWSWSLVCEVLSLDNQEQVVKFLDMWPQKAIMDMPRGYESMKRANFRSACAQYWQEKCQPKKKPAMPL